MFKTIKVSVCENKLMHESVKKIFYRETTLLGPVLVLVLAARPECPTKFFTK